MSCDNLIWKPGDVLTVRPENSDEQVSELFSIFQEHGFDFHEETLIELKEYDSGEKTKTYKTFFLTSFIYYAYKHRIIIH